MDRSLADQGVGPGSRVEIDKKNILLVKEMWSGGLEIRLDAFESQTLLDVLPSSWHQFADRLNICLEPSGRQTALDILMRDLFNQKDEVKIQIDRKIEFPLLLDHHVSRLAFSSRDQPRIGLPQRTNPREVMSGQFQDLVPTAQPMWSIQQRGYPFFNIDPLRVMYREGEKKSARFRVLRLPRDGLTEDVRQSRLAAGRNTARDERLMDGAGKDQEASGGPLCSLKDGGRLEMKAGPHCHSIRVFMSAVTLEWTERRPLINFSELTGQLAKLSRSSPFELLRKAFRCVGCGRKVCREEEEFQQIPAACCRERSLILLEVNDKSNQTRTPHYKDQACGTADFNSASADSTTTEAEQESGKTGYKENSNRSARRHAQTPVESYDDRGYDDMYDYTVEFDAEFQPPNSSLPGTTDSRPVVDDDTSVDVRLHLPKGSSDDQDILEVNWKKNETLSRVIQNIHRSRPFFPMNDIIVNGRQLSTINDWRQRTVAECDIQSGDEVEIEIGRPDSVTVLTMHVDGFHDRENIPLDINEWSWGTLWARINFFFATDGKMPVVFISMTFVDRLGKPQTRGVRGGNLLHGIVANYDEITGDEVVDDGGREVATTFANEFLHSTSGFRAPPRCSPILHIHPNCDVLCLPRPDAPISQVCMADDNILFDVESVALIWGLRSRQGRSDRWHLYIEHGDGSICNVEHGNTFQDASALPCTGNDVKRAILVLRNGDHVPYCRTSPNTPVKVWTRQELKYSVRDRVIHTNALQEKTFDALWVLTRSVGTFQRNFTDVMGRKP